MLMTFADQAFGELVLDAIERRECATIQLNTHFITAVQIGDFVEAHGEIVRKTRSLVFMRGFLTVGVRTVASIDGI
jgi:acyl-coenzyme A thioesterase PaaI-like protein